CSSYLVFVSCVWIFGFVVFGVWIFGLYKHNNKKVEKKDDEKKRDMSKFKCYNCKKEGHFTKDCKKVKVKDYEYYKTKMLLAKKDKDEQVLLAEDQAWMESSSDLDQEINANMVFMAQIEKVLSDLKTSSLSADDKIFKVSYYLSESESESEYETSGYYDNTTTYGLIVNDNDDQEVNLELSTGDRSVGRVCECLGSDMVWKGAEPVDVEKIYSKW
nr:hypothetical protein [Tanacetum cinerariifolium]